MLGAAAAAAEAAAAMSSFGSAARSAMMLVAAAALKRQPQQQQQHQLAARWLSAAAAAAAAPPPTSPSFRAADLVVEPAPSDGAPVVLPQELPFGRVFTPHMLLAEHDEAAGGWGAPRVVPFGPLMVHPAAGGLHYALGAFEGMKAYPGPDGEGRLFRPQLNMARLRRSARRLMLADFDPAELQECIAALLRRDRAWMPRRPGHAMYVRPFVFASEGALGVHRSARTTLCVILSPVGPYFASGAAPVRLYLDTRHVRAWPGGAGAHKVAGNYAPTVAPQAEAAAAHGCPQVVYALPPPAADVAAGRADALLDATLSECGAMNMFFVRLLRGGDGGSPDSSSSSGGSGAGAAAAAGGPLLEVVTPPLDGTILPGVTRLSILELLREQPGVVVSERPVTVRELFAAAAAGELLDAFGCGTACVVQPVGALVAPDGREVALPGCGGGALPAGAPAAAWALPAGGVAEWARKTLVDIQHGRVAGHPWSVAYEE